MNQSNKLAAPHKAAAQSFYGQSDDAFAKQIEQLAISDPRLVAVFQMTRAHYQSLAQS